MNGAKPISQIQEIERFFHKLSNHTKESNAQGLHDVSRRCEALFCAILNVLHGWNLMNLNELVSNHPVIDLGDQANQVGVQVTTRMDSARKNAATIENFDKEYPGIGCLSSQYNHLVILYMTMNKVSLPKTTAQSFRISVWNLAHLLDDMADLPQHQLEQILVPIRHAVEEGLLYKPPTDTNDRDFHVALTITESDWQSFFSYGLGSVRIDAFLPVTYKDTLSCALYFRDLQLSKSVKAFGEEEILGFFQHRQMGVSSERSFVVGVWGGKVWLSLKGERFEVEAYVADQLNRLFDALYDAYTDRLQRMKTILGSNGFEGVRTDCYKLMSMPTRIWDCMFHFANTHDALCGDTSWDMFCPQNSFSKRTIILMHGNSHAYKGDIICSIWCEYEAGERCTLYWHPGYSHRLRPMEGYDNDVKWTVSFLHQWILTKWLPYLFYENMLQHRSIFDQLFCAPPDLQAFTKQFVPGDYGISSCFH